MVNPDNHSSVDKNNAKRPQAKNPISMLSWLVLLIGLAALAFAIYSLQNLTKEEPIETITREGVAMQIQKLNRLETVAFSVDTVITSQKPGTQINPCFYAPACNK